MLANIFRWIVIVSALHVGHAAELDREIVLTNHTGSEPPDLEVRKWQEKARESSAAADTYERLAWAYVAKARRTLDAGFYKLAEKTVDVLDSQFKASFESRLIRGHVLHNLHRFSAAEEVARSLVKERGAAMDWALLSDALVEQGKMDEGVSALQMMVNLKPGAEAYSRIAYVRWFKGDRPGAVQILELALRSTDVRDAEARAWIVSRLSFLHLQQRDVVSALERAEQAVIVLADYPPALLARGRALVALGRLEDAIAPLTRAEELQPLPEYQWWLADVLRESGRVEEAERVEQRLVQRGADSDPRTLAIYLATRGEKIDRALRLAEAELILRGDVFTYDAVAWSLFAAGRTDSAREYLPRLREYAGSDARLLWHAAEIERATGNGAAAERHFADARALAATLTPSERNLLERRAMLPAEVATQ